MQSLTRTIAATTTLSIFLHGVVLAAVLLVYEHVDALAAGVGKSIDIQLVSAIMDSDQQETDVPRKREVVQEVLSETTVDALINRSTRNIVTSQVSEQAIFPAEPDDKSSTVQKNAAMQKTVLVSEADSSAPLLQSTSASSQQHSILELLHARISDNKKYPYIARRQRREGVATIAFVLHPDGKIENAHLLNSSRTRALDRAALSAVRQIEPFSIAQDYLKRSERFQVDVEFNLL
jgi:TonB family protein